MRDEALGLAALDRADLTVADVGAGTGFTTEGIVAAVAAERVTMIDQSPHQLARARAKGALAAVAKHVGDAEALPLDTDSVDRYVSAGSIEYWPDPQRAIAEAYRVVRPGGVAVVIGPLRRTHPLARRLSDAWMLFPADDEYRGWMEAAGFSDVRRLAGAPPWGRGRGGGAGFRGGGGARGGAAVGGGGGGRLGRRDRGGKAGGGRVAGRHARHAAS